MDKTISYIVFLERLDMRLNIMMIFLSIKKGYFSDLLKKKKFKTKAKDRLF